MTIRRRREEASQSQPPIAGNGLRPSCALVSVKGACLFTILCFLCTLASPLNAGIREATVKVRNPTLDRFGRVVQEDCGSATAVLRESGMLWYAGCGHNFHGTIGGKFKIEAFDGSEATATLERIDKTCDLALFSSKDYPSIDTIPVAVEPSISKRGIAAGYPGAGAFRETYVTFLPVRWSDEAGHPQLDMQCQEPMPEGVSGGPVVIDGELHGVISTGSATVPGDSGLMACTQPTLRDFVKPPLQKCTNGRCRLIDILRGRRAGAPPSGGGAGRRSPAEAGTPTGKPLKPIAHPGPLPPPPADGSPPPVGPATPDSAPPAPSPPGLTPDFIRAELTKLASDIKGHTTGEVAGAKTHTSNEADRLGTLATGGLSNAKDSILLKLKDPATAEEIAKKLGSPDAAAIAEKVLAGIPAAEPIIQAGASALGIGSIATGVGAPLGIAVLVAQLLGSWMHSRAIGKLGQKATPPPNGNGSSQPQPPSPPASAGAPAQPPATTFPVVVQSPPPAAVVIPERTFSQVETDVTAKALDWSLDQLVRKFPGTEGTAATIQSLVSQYRSGKVPA